jgi:type II secretory pathway predicted ATPase ExeA/cell division septation protein DedD
MAVTTAGLPEQRAGYETFFGLNESPFNLVPDPRFLFASSTHSAALAQVAYALEHRDPLVVITGDIGTGKTLLCRTVLQRLPFKTFLSVINDPLLEADDLVKELLRDFGVIAKDPARFRGATRHELVQTLHAFLSSLAPIQAHAVVMIDEAQHLRPDVLEQIRLLSNIDDSRGTILQIILVGQMDLEPLLSRPELRQLQQRVSRRFALDPLNKEEVQQYIEHRLALARQGEPAPAQTNAGVIFKPDAIEAVAEISAGVPRVINLLCDRSLELACDAQVHTIDAARVHAAARGLGVEQSDAAAPTPRRTPPPAEVAAPPQGAPEPATERAALVPTPAVAAPEIFGTFEPVDEMAAELLPAETAAPRTTKLLALVLLAVVLGAAGVFGYLRMQRPASEVPPPAAATSRAPAPATPAPAAQSTPQPASPGAAQAPPAAAATEPPATADRFDVIVASFRTDARATTVAEQVEALGVPVRRRESDGWQQVIAGPFASREEADAGRQRLEGAGLAGTQIVLAGR